MYSIDEKILQAYAANSREIYVKAIFNNTTVIAGDKIKSFTITDSVGNTEGLSLGNACSKKLELDTFVSDNLISIAKAKIEIEIGIDVDGTIEYTPLGVFYVDDCKTTNDYKSVKITAFDAMLMIHESLGDKYTCGLDAADVTPLEVISDICSQAGVSVSVANATERKSVFYNRAAEGILYDINGANSDSLCSIGTTNLIAIPNNTEAIDIKLYGMEHTGLTCKTFRAVYFKDADGQSVYSYEDYPDNTFGDTIDFDENDNPFQYIEGTIIPPAHRGMLYLGFDFNTSDFESLPDGIYFEVSTNYQVINYVNDNVTVHNPQKVEISARDMLGYMAGILGCNAVIDRTGALTIKKFEVTSNIIPYKLQYMNGLEKTHETVLPIEYLTTGSSTDEGGNGGTITVGSGSYGFNFENPYITSEQAAQNILNLYKGLELLPCNVNYRGNPSVDCGDIISVQDKDLNYHNVLVLNNTLSVTGGLSAKIDSGLKTDIKQDFISIPASKRVEHKVDSFIAAYQDVIEELTGVKGGYVQQVRDTNNVVRALAITQSNIQVVWDETNGKVIAADSSDKGTPMWIWSYGGLSFSPNGGTSYSAAINMQGQIYAEMIVGKLSKFVELQAELGTIGGWIIDKDSMYSDYGDYRAYIQTPSASKQWVFSTQKKVNSNGSYAGTFIVEADGTVNLSVIRDLTGNSVIQANGNNLWIGYGYLTNSLPTYLGGKQVYLRHTGDGVTIQKDGNTRMTFNLANWNFSDIDGEKFVSRDTVESTGGLVLAANGGNNTVYIVGSSIRLRANTYVNGKLSAPTIDATGGIRLKSSENNYHLFYQDGYIVLGGGNHAIQLNSGDYAIHFYAGTSIQCHANLKLNFSTTSGSAPLYVNSSGIVTASTSSERYKENITTELSEELKVEKLYDLPVKQYNYKKEYRDVELISGTQIGITAEDVEKYYPNALIRNAEGQAESWQDRIMIPAMLKLIQQQKKEIDALKNQQNELSKRLSDLEDIIAEKLKE